MQDLLVLRRHKSQALPRLRMCWCSANRGYGRKEQINNNKPQQ
jgi:hypothetical protein